MNLVYFDLDIIIDELKAEIVERASRALAVGVTWGRNLRFHGGAYTVSVLLFE